MSNKKKAYLQQFGIIHLPNPNLTYIRNLREKQNYIYVIPPLENLNQEPFLCYLFLFSPSHLTRNHDANRASRAYICIRAGGWFFPSCQKLPSLLPNCWRSIFNVFVKNQRWQLDLLNCWRCSVVFSWGADWDGAVPSFVRFVNMGSEPSNEQIFIVFGWLVMVASVNFLWEKNTTGWCW